MKTIVSFFKESVLSVLLLILLTAASRKNKSVASPADDGKESEIFKLPWISHARARALRASGF